MTYLSGLSEYWNSITKDWSATNWIAIVAAVISIASVLINNRAANLRDRVKGRREEFNKQIVAPIEKSLDDFQAVIEELYEMAWDPSKASNESIDSCLLKARKAQAKLSRSLRKAGASDLSESEGWSEIGTECYDDFIECIEMMREQEDNKADEALSAANSLEGIIEQCYHKIYLELRIYV